MPQIRRPAARRPAAQGPRSPDETAPDQRVVSKRQAVYLAELSGVSSEELAGKPLAALEGLLRWKIDPELLGFRRVCGRVVRRDPVTGVIQGVPNATVHVEDTDCTFLGFFPVENPWWWLWPVSCTREDVATVVTDECGRFCVWIPRWEVDRILRFRRERICFPDIVKPSIRDILEELRPEPPRIKWPPLPDPPPPVLDDPMVLDRAGELMGPAVAEKLRLLGHRQGFGGATGEMRNLLMAPAFEAGAFPPPLSADALERAGGLQFDERAKLATGAGAHLESPKMAALLERPFHGPFIRCRDVFVLEWQLFFDVPDITFRVTQDVDGDGAEETIYAEGFFDVRWNAGAIPNVILEASAIARPSATCDGPAVVCQNVPAIRTVGLMPLEPTHHDAATGYSTRVNRPRPGGLTSDPPSYPARTPYAGTLQLHGCHHIGNAAHYRLLYRFGANPEIPFTGLEWWAPRLGPGGPFHIQPDAAGWYPILPGNLLVFPHWLLNWPTTAFANGRYVVRLQLANAAKVPIPGPAGTSAPVAFTIDNHAPQAGFTQLRWRMAGGAWHLLPLVCPTIRRPTGTDIDLEVRWWANAPHFRDAVLSAWGCGGDNPLRLDGPPPPGEPGAVSDFDHWHTGPADNAMVRTALFRLAANLPEGSYAVGIDAHSRAFNPAGDGGGPGVNWLADYAYLHAHPSMGIALIDV